MRKAFLAALLIIIAIALTPFGLGLYTEYYIKQLVSQAEVTQGIYVEIKDYRRGYLRSEADYELSFYQPMPNGMPRKVLSLETHDEIQHGPIFSGSPRFAIAQIHSYLTAMDVDVPEEQQLALAQLFIEEEIFQSDTSIRFDNSFHIKMKVSGIEQQQEDGNLQWGGLLGEIKLSSNLYKMYLTLDVAPLLLHANEKTIMDFSRMTMVLDAKRSQKTPWVGKHDVSIKSFFFESSNGEVLRLDNFLLSADSTIKKDEANIDINLRASHLEILAEIINDLKLSASLEHLDAFSLLRVGELTNEETILSPSEKQELSRTMVYLFTPGSEIKLNGSAKLDAGDAKGNITVMFPDVSALVPDEDVETIAQSLVMNLEANLSYSVPVGTFEELLYFIATQGISPDAAIVVNEETGETARVVDLIKQSIDEEITVLRENDILLNDGKHYTLHLGYDRGAIILNGSQLSQEDLARIMSIFQTKKQ